MPEMERIARWNTRAVEVCDRLHETINAKIEGDAGRLPERGMFNCGDVLAAVGVIAELRAELAGVIAELEAAKHINNPDGSISDERLAEAFETFYSAWSKAWGVPMEAKTLGASS